MTIRFPLQLKISFGGHIPPDQLAGFVRRHREIHFGIAYERAVLSWFDSLPPNRRTAQRGALTTQGVDHRVPRTSKGQEVPMFTQLFPILTTPDLKPALGFYRDLLGATVAYEFPGPNGEPAYVGLDLGSSHIGIGVDPSKVAGPSDRFSLWAYADDTDAAVARLRGAGVTIAQVPADQPWGERTAQVLDPDGNLVHIGSR